jgi:hypothetical protein
MRGRIARDVDRWVIVGAAAALLLAAFVPGPIGILAGIIAGSLVSIAASQYYSKQASRELRSEAATLRRETAKLREEAAKQKDTTLIMRGLEEAGLVEYVQNENGKRIGVTIKGSAAMGGQGSMLADATVKKQGDQSQSGDDTPDDEARG